MKIAALMLTGSDFYATRAKACFETWLPAFDAFAIHSFAPCEFLTITKTGTREGEGSCFEKRIQGLGFAPTADWYFCCSCDNYVWANNLRTILSHIRSDHPVIIGTDRPYNRVLQNGLDVKFLSGGAGYCLNRLALKAIIENIETLRSEWMAISGDLTLEDVFMSWAAEKMEFEIIRRREFHPSNPSRGHGFEVPPENVISLHQLTSEQIRTLHTDGARKVFVPTISLCMICGNEENVILRCLDSSRDAFDELCLVSAVGNQTADSTLYVAEKWCAENGKEFKGGRYSNSYDLPHVDDFGAARNQSFAMATKDWQLWLDCDDYLDAINCARIREAVTVIPADINGIYANYLIEKQGAEITRERLIRRGFGKWRSAIHETCEMTGPTMDCPQIKIFHGEHRHKDVSSATRNAAILLRTVQDAPRHYFYLHTELKMLKAPEAIKYGRIALSFEMDPEQRYIVLLNMSELEPGKRSEYLHEAARLQPHRREAFAYLCKAALIEGRTSDAVSYFRMMDSLPLPSPLPWTHQGIWYSWARNALRVDCLRACKQTKQADIDHAQHMKDPDYAEGTKDK